MIKNGKAYKVSKEIMDSRQKRLFTQEVEDEAEEKRIQDKKRVITWQST